MSENEFADPNWRYFIAAPGSETSTILDGIERACIKANTHFLAAKISLPVNARIIAFAYEGMAIEGHGVAFTGDEDARKKALPDTEWEPLFSEGADLICQPRPGSVTEVIYNTLTKYVNAGLDKEFFWKLEDDENKNNPPANAVVCDQLIDEGGQMEQKRLTPEVAHFDGGYLIRVPVKPVTKDFYCPPSCTLLTEEGVREKAMKNFSFSDLPPFKAEVLPNRMDSYDRRTGIKTPVPTAEP